MTTQGLNFVGIGGSGLHFTAQENSDFLSPFMA
jgi:hypothetical protein